MTTFNRILTVALGAAVFLVASAARANIIVTSNLDDGRTGNCSLRDAIQAVNTQTAVDLCPAGVFGDTIVLPTGTMTMGTTPLTILVSVTLQGSGYERTTIDFGGRTGGIVVGNGTVRPAVSFQYLSIANVDGTLVTVKPNAVAFLDYTQLLNGISTSSAGGLAIQAGGSGYVFHSIVANNSGFAGAGIGNDGSLNVQYATFTGNHGEHGSGINNTGAASVSDSTFANNIANLEGAAIYNFGGTFNLDRVTIAYNTSNFDRVCDSLDSRCGAVYRNGGTVRIKGSIVAHNTATGQTYNQDCSSLDPSPTSNVPYDTGITSLGYNLLGTIASNGCPKTATDVTPQNARLSGTTPAFFGGVGSVFLPAANSPVLNRIPSSDAYCNASYDQRMLKRGRTSACELGAVERSTAALIVGDPNTLQNGDTTVKGALEWLGFTVTLVDDNNASTTTGSGQAVVVVSESVTSTNVNTQLRDVDTGVLVLEPSLFDDMKMTGTATTQFGNSTNQQLVTIRGTSVGQTLGQVGMGSINVQPYTGNQTLGWGKPGGSATKHMLVTSDTTKAALFDYFRGATLADGTSLAGGHRVGFFAFPDTAVALTTGGHLSGIAMLYQAILLAGIE